MDIVKQLSLFLPNRPGALSEILDELAKNKVNIYALMTSDAVDHSVVRMVVSDTLGMLQVLGARGVLVVENDVLMIENDNKPGSLSAVATKLAAKNVNIGYAYLATAPKAKRGLLILRVNNPRKALDILSRP